MKPYWPALALIGVVVAGGVEWRLLHHKSDQTVDGLAEARWLELADDSNAETRHSAFVALANFDDPAAKAKLKAGLKLPPEALVCASAIALEAPDDAVAALKERLTLERPSPTAAATDVSSDLFHSALIKLGMKAMPLVPVMKEIQRRAKNDRDRQCLQEAIDLVR